MLTSRCKVCNNLSNQVRPEETTMNTMTPEQQMIKRMQDAEKSLYNREAQRELGLPGKPAKVVDVRDLMKGIKK